MPLYTKISNKGLKGYRLYFEPVENKWYYEHSRFDKQRQEGYIKNYVTHHCNYNRLDNRPINLQYISKSKHKSIHNRNQSDEERSKRSKSVKLWHEKNKGTDIYKARSEHIIVKVNEYIQNHPEELKQRHKNTTLSYETKQKMSRKDERLYTNGKVRKYFKIGQPIPSDFIKCESKNSLRSKRYNLNKIIARLIKGINIKLKQRKIQLNRLNSKLFKQLDEFTKPNKIKNRKMPKRPYKLKRNTQMKNLVKVLKKVAYCKLNNKQYNELSIEELYRAGTIFRNMIYPNLIHCGTNVMKGYKWYNNGTNEIYTNNKENLPDNYVPGRLKKLKNHKIIKIEKLNKYEKVYDLEIEDNPNFALDAGVFVHNSIKILDDGTKVKSTRKRYFR